MTAWYNENNPYCAEWLRNLIRAGHIAPGDVDERSIVDVQPTDLKGYTQCHFFAGIGGWSLAARIAGWPDTHTLWTGSPPCQDVSLGAAVWGVRTGLSGDRTSLVFKWLRLIDAVRPSVAAFENVPGIKRWIAQIEGRLEDSGYNLSRSERSTADIGGPHLRRRVWRLAYRDSKGQQKPRRSGTPAPFSDPRRTPPGDVWSPAPNRAVGMDDGFPARVAAIRAFGNAIDPWAAARILEDYLREAS
jgi:DNA (cytosine-5)-methyltransferase 1